MTWNDVCNELATLEAQVLETCTPHPASDCGLDRRCGTVYLGGDFLATRNERDLSYFGGFEYIPAEDIQRIGSITLYSMEHPRVLEAIRTLEHNHD